MRPTVHRYHFGRLYLRGSWADLREYILRSLRADVYEPDRQYKYGIFDVRELTHQEHSFVFGRLVKYKHLLEGELVDEGAKRLMEGWLPEGVVGKASFFLHCGSWVIAYRPIANRISDHQFRVILPRLIKAANARFFVDANIESIEEELSLMRAVMALDTVERITVDIHRPNPSLRDVWRPLHERMQAIGAQRLRESVEARGPGLNKQAMEQDEVYRGLAMATDGYGSAAVQGIIDGRKVVVKTGDSPVIKEVMDSEDPEVILGQLYPAFQQIWERMRQ